MAQQSPDYKQLLQEAGNRIREADKRILEEQQGRLEERQGRLEEQRGRLEEQEKRLKAERKTTLPEFLDASHHVQLALVVLNKALSTKGNPENANYKVRPRNIRPWDSVPGQLAAIWEKLMVSDFILEQHFPTLIWLQGKKEELQESFISSEDDLSSFLAQTINKGVSSIIKKIYSHPKLRDYFQLKGSVTFVNHKNTLTPSFLPESTISLGKKRRRSASSKQTQAPNLADQAETVDTSKTKAKECNSSCADQFCVYNRSETSTAAEEHIPVFVIEYKAPHKLTLGHINAGLHDMELEHIVKRHKKETKETRFRRMIAAVITQAFSYMIQLGLEYGCVSTGEASIFLRIPYDDPTLVYYYLSVPKGDVQDTTGWTSDITSENRLHLTAMGQMLAFTLLALKTPPREQQWRDNAISSLERWKVEYEDLLRQTLADEAPSSDYRLPYQNDYLRMSPIQLRKRPVFPSTPSCRSKEYLKEDNDDKPDPDTPSKPPRQSLAQHVVQPKPSATSTKPQNVSSSHGSEKAKERSYCTQMCLRGLLDGGLLDQSCPNVGSHGSIRHQISQPCFTQLMREQLGRDRDTDVINTGVHGACGALLKVTLTSYGYTLVAKGTIVENAAILRREAMIYERLRSIQGIHVPVHLGNIDLIKPYYYGLQFLVHLMFISYSGVLVDRYTNSKNKADVICQTKQSVNAIHDLGVLHRDLDLRNILWDARLSHAIVIDFERSQILRDVKKQSRPALAKLSTNRKRKMIEDGAITDIKDVQRIKSSNQKRKRIGERETDVVTKLLTNQKRKTREEGATDIEDMQRIKSSNQKRKKPREKDTSVKDIQRCDSPNLNDPFEREMYWIMVSFGV